MAADDVILQLGKKNKRLPISIALEIYKLLTVK